MTIQNDRTNDSAELERDEHTVPADANQTSLVCLATYAPAVVLFSGYVYDQLHTLGEKVHVLEEQLDCLGTTIERQYRQHDEHVAILAACQRDTAAVLNHEIDRHALHPAVETVVALAEELSHLKDCASQLPEGGAGAEEMDRLRTEIDISCTVAREKLAHLDVQMITQAEGEQLDAKVHLACGYAATMDGDLQGKISKLVTPGIAYRGKVLRQARVTVFRVKNSADPQ